MKSLSRVQLLETPWTAAYQASPSMEFSRQEYWSGVPLPSPGSIPYPAAIACRFFFDDDDLFFFVANANANAKSLQLCPTLCDPIDGSPPGSPVPGILKARTLEWVAISFSNA